MQIYTQQKVIPPCQKVSASLPPTSGRQSHITPILFHVLRSGNRISEAKPQNVPQFPSSTDPDFVFARLSLSFDTLIFCETPFPCDN